MHPNEGALAETSDMNAVPEFQRRHGIAVMFSHYPSDPRPRRAAEALTQAGMHMEVICIKQNDQESATETFNGVHITRVPMKRKRGGKLGYFWQYGSFLLASLLILARRSLRRRYALVHVHNMPDILVFSALFPKLRGAKVILDLHDPMPELMTTIFGLDPASGAVRLLKVLERWSTRFADRVLVVNEACRRLFSQRGCPLEKIHVVMNSPDERIFCEANGDSTSPKVESGTRPFVIMYHGSIVERHGLDLAVTALQNIEQSVPSAELRIYGQSTPFLEKVLNSVKGTGLESRVRYLGPKNLEEIVVAIRACDVGVIPNRRSIFTQINTPTRIFEYLSQGKPVIAPRVPGIQDYFGPDELVFFELGDAADLKRQLEFVYRNPAAIHAITKAGQAVYRHHQWSKERFRFLSLVRELTSVASVRHAGSPEGVVVKA